MAKLVAGNTYTDQELLDLYREAYAKISVKGQSYTIDNRTFTAADLPEIREQIEWLEQRVDGAASGITMNDVEFKRR